MFTNASGDRRAGLVSNADPIMGRESFPYILLQSEGSHCPNKAVIVFLAINPLETSDSENEDDAFGV